MVPVSRSGHFVTNDKREARNNEKKNEKKMRKKSKGTV